MNSADAATAPTQMRASPASHQPPTWRPCTRPASRMPPAYQPAKASAPVSTGASGTASTAARVAATTMSAAVIRCRPICIERMVVLRARGVRCAS